LVGEKIPRERSLADDNGSVELSAAKLLIVFTRASQSASAYTTSGITSRGLHIGEFAVLEVLLHKGPLTTAAIAQKTRMTAALIVPAIDRLETLGHVRRRRTGGDDRRSWMVELTPAGQSLIADIYEDHAASIEEVFRPLSSAERLELYRVLKKIGLRPEGLQLARFKDGPGALSPSQLRRATSYLGSISGSPSSVAEIAGKVGLSAAQFSRAFKNSTGFPPYRWQLNLRIAKAQELLRYGSLPLAEIALATGFAEQSHFTRIFKKVTGVSPGAWQRDHRQ
jgi:AraC-like DNA-binding protein/DNA-binding MarR family transcriptional regulator